MPARAGRGWFLVTEAEIAALCNDYWASGFSRGLEEGRRAAEAEMAAAWGAVARRVQGLGRPESVPYDVLAERRGEDDRAERQRRILHERGVA